MKRLDAVQDNGLGNAATSAIANASPDVRKHLKEILGGPGAKTADRRAAIETFAGLEDKQRSGLLGEFDQYKKDGGKGPLLDFMRQRSAAMRPEPEEEQRLHGFAGATAHLRFQAGSKGVMGIRRPRGKDTGRDSGNAHLRCRRKLTGVASHGERTGAEAEARTQPRGFEAGFAGEGRPWRWNRAGKGYVHAHHRWCRHGV